MTHSLSGFFSWLDALPAGQQALVTGGILLAVPAIAGGAFWLVRLAAVSALGWHRRSISSAEAERLRLMPQPKMGIIDAHNADTVASERIKATVEGISRVQAEFKSQSQTVIGRMNAVRKPVPQNIVDQLMGEMARTIDRYAGSISKHTKDFKAAVRMLSDAWSCRLYWHDKRGSAREMLDDAFIGKVHEHLKLARSCKETWGRSESAIDEGIVGWTGKLDRASDKVRTQLSRLMEAFTEHETNCERVLEFHRQRNGIRGLLRRIGLRRFLG